MVACKQRGHAGKTGKAREGWHYVVHIEILQIEASGCSLLCLPIARWEMTIAIGVSPGRSDVRRVQDISIDEIKLNALLARSQPP